MRTPLSRRLLSAVLLGLAASAPAWADPVDRSKAQAVVSGWLRRHAAPLQARLGGTVAKVEAHRDAEGRILFYAVDLKPSGFVVVAPDDFIEPVIAFSPVGRFQPDPNGLYDVLTRDLKDRLDALAAPARAEFAGSERAKKKAKWDFLFMGDAAPSRATLAGTEAAAAASINDPRVDPFIASTWDQGDSGGGHCYNYYTPNYDPCGCVATAMAQIMRYHRFPTAGIGVHSFDVTVDSVSRSVTTRGGNGSGGAYDWSLMPLAIPSSATDAQRSMIGALTYDAGLAVNMSYTASGSGTDTLMAADALKTTFGYANAVKYYNAGNEVTGATFNTLVNANLDARLPVQLGITGTAGGHSIVCDGYGYNAGTLYHHLNMGWSGSDNAWYELPAIGTWGGFSKVYKVIYNIYPSGGGEILSGRVLDASGAPLSGATVTAGGLTATTDARGIYALPHIPAGTYTVTAAKSGYAFTAQTKTVGTSSDTGTTGDLWGVDFKAGASQTVSVTVTPGTATVAAGGTVQFTASVTGSANTSVTWSATGGSVGAGGLYTAPATAGTYTVKATSVADPSRSASATVTVTTSGPKELVLNGGFESGAASWSGTTGDIGTFSAQPAYAGAKDAWLCGNGSTATESLSQSIAVPAGAASVSLSFQLHIDTKETTTSTAYDKLQVQVISGTTTTTLATYSNLNRNTGYAKRTLDLSAYRGKTVTLKFLGTEDGSLQTSFVIDAVSVLAQ